MAPAVEAKMGAGAVGSEADPSWPPELLAPLWVLERASPWRPCPLRPPERPPRFNVSS